MGSAAVMVSGLMDSWLLLTGFKRWNEAHVCALDVKGVSSVVETVVCNGSYNDVFIFVGVILHSNEQIADVAKGMIDRLET